MADVKTIVVPGVSPNSWEDAVRQVVREASASVGEIIGVEVLHQSAEVNGGDISQFRAVVQISFLRV